MGLGYKFAETCQEAVEVTANVGSEENTQTLTAEEKRLLLAKAFDVMLAVAGGGADPSTCGPVLAGVLDDVFRKLVALEEELKRQESVEK